MLKNLLCVLKKLAMSLHSTISQFIGIPTEPHDIVWNQGINEDLGPACTPPLISRVPAKVPEQIKS